MADWCRDCATPASRKFGQPTCGRSPKVGRRFRQRQGPKARRAAKEKGKVPRARRQPPLSASRAWRACQCRISLASGCRAKPLALLDPAAAARGACRRQPPWRWPAAVPRRLRRQAELLLLGGLRICARGFQKDLLQAGRLHFGGLRQACADAVRMRGRQIPRPPASKVDAVLAGAKHEMRRPRRSRYASRPRAMPSRAAWIFSSGMRRCHASFCSARIGPRSETREAGGRCISWRRR